jgi:ERCC4-type nuclease|tara:strand:+ start:2394 stop:2891 length:498 start_codon:yes stop_codon:yes gene_type:complete
MGKIRPFTIIKDTREKQGYTFEASRTKYHVCKGMVVRKLDTGDYSVEGLEDKVCIERKASVVELANNVGVSRRRFDAEIERMKEFPHRFLILEFSLTNLMDFPEGSDVPDKEIKKLRITNKYMLRYLMELQINHGVNVIFCDSKKNAKWTVLSILKRINEKYALE